MSRVVCISDTHGQHASLAVPDGDVLVFAGDACSSGTPGEWRAFCRWLGGLPHAHKVVVPGNHDWPLQPSVPAWGVSARHGPTALRHARRRAEDAGAVLLVDREAMVAGLRIYGSPWVPAFHGWAFNLPRGGAELAEVWSRVPQGLDVLVTHAPAFGTLDRTERGDRAGCERLADRLLQLDATGVGPQVHIHGDIHEAAGVHAPPLGADGRMTVNASVLDARYRLSHAPIMFDIEARASGS